MSDTITAPNITVRSWASGNGTLIGLTSALPGRLIVSYDPSLNQTATVVVTTSSNDLADLIQTDIVPAGKIDIGIDERGIHMTGSDQQLKLSLAQRDVDITASLLVQVTFNRPIADLTTTAETIVQNGALSLQDTLSSVGVTSLGSHNVWVDSVNAVTVSKLELTAGGRGSVFLTAPAVIATKRAKLTVLGDGAIGVQTASVTAGALKTSVLGSGSAYVHGTVDATVLQSEVLGSGSVNYYPSGHCGNSKITILGSGSAYTASLACNNTKVDVLGSGSAYVQTVNTLSRSGFGSGRINYFNITPAHLPKEKKRQWFFTPKAPAVVAVTENKYKTFEVAPEPSALQEGVAVHVVQHIGWFSWPPIGSTADVPIVDSSAMTARLGHSTSTEAYGVGALAMMLVVAVAFVLFKKKQRGGYQPLL
ncbi:hypothetical protein DYB32_003727 [Aphanomyces invadans]|uniref:Putative auto-transporter adhesin head GIN domain-containing protein n=1 Tax=Aphanomyces invadans TaxID=157072 RepID=A0A3R7D290_9STRA|nr:hypothetical protein DYB32_003727 [Aphanomyces invadans]